MIHAQYCRLHVRTSASEREVIRAARRLLSEMGRTPAMREERHRWLRLILAEHKAARRVFDRVKG